MASVTGLRPMMRFGLSSKSAAGFTAGFAERMPCAREVLPAGLGLLSFCSLPSRPMEWLLRLFFPSLFTFSHSLGLSLLLMVLSYTATGIFFTWGPAW